MPTSRPLRQGDLLINVQPGQSAGLWSVFSGGQRDPRNYVLMSDFGLEQHAWELVSERIFGIRERSPQHLAAAITNGTAPGLYVREGDDTSDWETYRQVLARRVEEAMAARRRGGETATATAAEMATARQDDEIRVGDVVEVVSCNAAYTSVTDVGRGGSVSALEDIDGDPIVRLEPCSWLRLPQAGVAGLADVRKVPSSSPQTVAANISPIPDGEAANGMRRRSVVDGMRGATPRDFTAAGITNYLQSLGATHIHVNQAPGSLPVIEVTGLSQQAFDTARQNLPVGVQLRAAGGVVDPVVGVYLGPVIPTSQSQQPPRIRQVVQRELDRLYGRIDAPSSSPPPPTIPPPPPSRFSLLEVDLPPEPTSSTRRSLDADLAALQDELRAERERNRALAAVQTQKNRFDLLECDLPAVPVAAAPMTTVVTKASSRPVASSPPPRRSVETITDLTAARSPLELARMLEGLNDELSTMMRQREAN